MVMRFAWEMLEIYCMCSTVLSNYGRAEEDLKLGGSEHYLEWLQGIVDSNLLHIELQIYFYTFFFRINFILSIIFKPLVNITINYFQIFIFIL